MQTMHPCIMLGSYILDADRLPADEFRLRLDPIHRRMDERKLGGLLVYGDAREHGALAYLSNFIPRMRWGMALFPRRGEPVLLCSMSSRDMPAMRTMTWIGQVNSGWEWKWFDDWVAACRAADLPRDIGTIGFDLMAPSLYRKVEHSLGSDLRLIAVDDFVAKGSKRPREITLLRTGCGIVEKAAASFARSWRETRDPERAALDAERCARMMAAQDVRSLVSFDDGRTLESYRGTFDHQTRSAVGYFAIKFAGYWSDAFVTVGAPAALSGKVTAGLDALLHELRPGATAAALHRRVSDILGDVPLHAALSGSVGHAIGLSLHDGQEFRSGETAAVERGGVYALQVGLGSADAGAFASAVVRIGDGGAEVLSRFVPT